MPLSIDDLVALVPEEERGQPVVMSIAPEGEVEIKRTRIHVTTEYNWDLVEALKMIEGRSWTGVNNTFPLESAFQVVQIADEFGLDVPQDVRDLAEQCRIEEAEIEVLSEELTAASIAKDADIKIDGLGGELLPFQRAGVAYALATRRTFIADEMGLGKTVEALATLQAAQAFPAVVVCPATLKLNWKREAEKWLPGKTVEIVSGRTCYDVEADIIIVNYDILDAWKECFTLNALVLDESHLAKTPTSKRTKAAIFLAKKVPATGVVLALTGTPVINKPSELVSQLNILGALKSFGGAKGFHQRYCEWDGWGWSGGKNLKELNERLRGTCYVRRTKTEVLTELPPKRRANVPVTLEPPARKLHDRAVADLLDLLGEQAREKAYEDGTNANQAERLARARAQAAEALVRLNTLRRVTGEGKIPLAKDWIENFLTDSDEKLVVFAHHKSVVQGLVEMFDAPRIDGSATQLERQAAVDLFQDNGKTRLIICSIKAAGIGITLTAASNVLFIESDWTPAGNSQAEDRLHRIGQTDSVTAWYLQAEDTVDERISELLAEKALLVDAATEGKDVESTTGVTSALLDEFRGTV